MKIVLLGPPGTGKGSQAKLIAEKYNLCHISTGDIFREKRKENSSLGKKVKELIDKGSYVPDNITNKVVKERLQKTNCKKGKKGFVLDGFPRTVPQAKALEKFIHIDHLIYIVSDEKKIIERLRKRRSCPTCGRIYNIASHPSKKGEYCEDDNTKLILREDDKPATVKKRLEVYKKQTHPVIEFYKKKGKLTEIDGNKSVKEVFNQIKQALGN
ncbi:MAG: adenylate kinase [Candidatus Woesearchaeota archaeon]